MIVDCRDDTTFTSSAAGLPCVKESRNPSAGRDRLLLLNFFFSSEGLKLKETQEKKFISQTIWTINIISSSSTC